MTRSRMAANRRQQALRQRRDSAAAERERQRHVPQPVAITPSWSGSVWLLLAASLLLIWLLLQAAPVLASDAAQPATQVRSQAAVCPAVFHQQMKQLHSSKILNVCDVVNGRPVLLVNTASHCGFSGQFADLETLHETYKDRGLVVIGVASNSFDQEAKTEEEAADVCFKNFGVTFTMMAPVPVKGADAHPLFQEMARQAGAPRWNFYKYLLNADGKVVESWSSFGMPDDDDLAAVLTQQPDKS
ncbi:glutathione peroxidase [Candidatus Thalassolituus haligoni]|uniref:glutathione peroxidase n=1 Tax=Candidatus Thalassolituus haligoni TaxID=3100113 RepID=UPI003513DD3E